MYVHPILNQVILLSALVGKVILSYRLGLVRPSWLLPALGMGLLSLAVLLVSAIVELDEAWLWASTLYAVAYLCLVIALWRIAGGEQEEAPLTPVQHLPQTPALLLESENRRAVLVHGGDVRRPLCRDGQPADALLPGWSVAAVHNCFSPLVVISLVHSGGQMARWIVGVLNELYDEPVVQLPATVRDVLHAGTERRLQDIRSRGGAALAEWNAIPRTTRLELLADLEARAGSGEDGPSAAIAGWSDDSGQVLSVCSDDNLMSVVSPTGMEIPILREGTVLRHTDFQPGWAADVLYRDFAPFYLLELRHETGTRATWLLDRHLLVIGDINGLSQTTKDELCLRAAPIIERHLASVLAFAEPGIDPVVERYVQLNGDVRRVLAMHCAGAIKPLPTSMALREVPLVLPLTGESSGKETILLRRAAIEQAVTVDVHLQTVEAIRRGRLEWPSPVDGSAAQLQGIFMWGECVQLYQFTDRSGLDFVVIASDRCTRVIGLMVPAINLILYEDRSPGSHEPNVWLHNSLGGGFWWLLIRHVNEYAHEVRLRRRTAHARPVNVLLSGSLVHIGHHLWNDLSGLEALCNAIPPEQLPVTMIIGAAEAPVELFGPIEALFPTMRGRIDRSLETVDAFIRWTYRHDVWPTRITRDHVSAALRQRVMDHLAKASEAAQVRDTMLVRRMGRHRAPVVIFGLRVEDRTLVDLPAFCEAFVSFMAERHPGATVVFDGYNCRPGIPEGPVNLGMVHHLTSQPPEDVEAALVAALMERFAGEPVTIVGTTGQSIATSLAWCRHADAAFAIWGAGLAKIRWLANLPTMVVTGHRNLLHRSDLNIYHDAAFIEASAPVVFPDPSLVVDVHDHKALAAKFIQGGRECFMVQTDEILQVFDTLLTRALQDQECRVLQD